jgi:hypothetical protein
MCRTYVPIFLDWLQVTEELNAQEKGRLIDAIVAYAAGGDWQEQIKGNERYLFPAFRRQIDRENEISSIRSESRTGKTKDNKPEQKKETITKPIKTANNNKNNNNNDNKNDNNNDNGDTKRAHEEKLPNGFDRFWEVYPRKMAKAEAVKAFEKIKPDAMLIETMVKAVLKQRLSAQWKEDNGKYIPLPATWLNQRRWDDEMPAAQSTGKVVNAAKYTQREYTEDELDDATDELMREAAML